MTLVPMHLACHVLIFRSGINTAAVLASSASGNAIWYLAADKDNFLWLDRVESGDFCTDRASGRRDRRFDISSQQHAQHKAIRVI